jgi:hypothetical protein
VQSLEEMIQDQQEKKAEKKSLKAESGNADESDKEKSELQGHHAKSANTK